MTYAERTINSIVELLDALEADVPVPSEEGDGAFEADDVDAPVWFRGCTDAGYSLLPTLHRDGVPDRPTLEQELLSHFMQNASAELDVWPGDDEWEWLFLMRHYGVPSRLLDWTESPLVGVYFAVTPVAAATEHFQRIKMKDNEDGALWLLKPRRLNKATTGGTEIPVMAPQNSGRARTIDNFTTSQMSYGASLDKPIAGIAPRRSKRMQAQASVFTISGSERVAIEAVADEVVIKYTIPGDCKPAIREELERLGVKRLSVFPELDSVGLAARRASGV